MKNIICFYFVTLFILNFINGYKSENITTEREKYKVVVIGAGISGLGAATHLLKNNFTDILILEASNRIGGRIYTAPFGDYLMDYGAQWAVGLEDNIVYELAKLHDLVIHHNYSKPNFFINPESKINSSLVDGVFNKAFEYLDDTEALLACNCSLENYFDVRLKNLTKGRNVDKHTAQAVREIVIQRTASMEGTDDLSKIGAWGYAQYDTNEIWNIIWKNGYHSFIDVILGKYDGKELPILEKTRFHKVVKKIDWSRNEIHILCEDGSNYYADHVINTVSLGVLKHSATEMFTPSLPERKLSAIQSLGFDAVDKILIQFQNRWWPLTYDFDFNFLWSDEDKERFRSASKHGNWATEISGFHFAVNQPRVLEGWIVGKAARTVEQLSDKELIEGVIELLNWFVGHKYSISPPINVTKSVWGSNKFVRGSYSFRTLDSDNNGYSADDIAQPLPVNHPRPFLLFAGEATHNKSSGTVYGAYETGLREANRILSFHK